MVKFPEKSIAPPTVDSSGKLIAESSVLLAIWSAPPTLVRRGREILASLSLETNANEPDPVALLPTDVKLGAAREVI